MTHASVFSGIGGPEVAATMLGWENLFHCEINPFGRRVLDYWYPNSKSYEDITTTDFTEWRGRVNVLTGGFPCQPFSYAGQRRGATDDRYLWPYMFRCIDQIRPDWVVAENVAGILTMVEQGEVSEVASAPALFDSFDDVRRYQLRETFTLQRICDDLEGHGYAVQPVLVPACGVGAPHRRDRVFIIGHRIDADTSDAGLAKTRPEQQAAGTAGDGTRHGKERHEVRKPDEPNQVRREGGRDALSDTYNERLRRGSEKDSREWTYPETIFGGKLLSKSEGCGSSGASSDTESEFSEWCKLEQLEACRTSQEQSGGRGGENGHDQSFADYYRKRLERWYDCEEGRPGQAEDRPVGFVNQDNGIGGNSRWLTFPSVSPVHRGNDGIPFDVDRLTISFGKWRTEALKAYGNAIVPQVMYEIFRAIQQVEQDL